MRNYLLAGAAMFGATVAVQGSAYAQAPAAPVLPAPQMQTLITPNFGKSANDNNNYQAVMIPGAVVNPTPGSMVVRLNGKIWSEFSMEGSTGDVPGNGNKEAPYNMGTYLRLYPGVDGMSTNGLRWGAQAEIRENFKGQGFTATGSGVGLTATNALNSSGNCCSSVTCEQTLYVRRAFVYVAMDQLGILRLGQGDGISGIFDNGNATFQNFGSGGWNGDAPAAPNGNSQPTFPWYSQQGAEYGSNKIVYLSPQFAGFDIGLEYAPNNGNLEYNCGAAGIGCPSLSSSAQITAGGTPTDNFRFTNLVQAGVRYQGVLGPTSVYAFGDYIGSGVIDYTGPLPTGLLPNTKYNGKMNGISAGFIGLNVTYAGFTVGGAWQGGRYNNVMAPPPKGGTNAQAYLIGAMYVNGPFTVGASWYGFDDQGAVQLSGISQQHENAWAVGGNWQITPGLQLYADYLYGLVHQGGYNFVSGSVNPAATQGAHNNGFSQAFLVGLLVGW